MCFLKKWYHSINKISSSVESDLSDLVLTSNQLWSLLITKKAQEQCKTFIVHSSLLVPTHFSRLRPGIWVLLANFFTLNNWEQLPIFCYILVTDQEFTMCVGANPKKGSSQPSIRLCFEKIYANMKEYWSRRWKVIVALNFWYSLK